MKRIKKMTMVFALLILVVGLCGYGRDTSRYDGQYPEGYSIAGSTVLGVHGGESPKVELIEQDSYGRSLFHYREITSYVDGSPGISALLICQMTDDNYAYYYPNWHFIVRHSFEEFTSEQIEELKKKNDWEKSLNTDKMVSVPIAEKRDHAPYSNADLVLCFASQKPEWKKSDVYFCDLGRDESGRWLFYARVCNKESQFSEGYLALYTPYMPDQTARLNQVEKIPNADLWEYQEQLKKFKDASDWEVYVELKEEYQNTRQNSPISKFFRDIIGGFIDFLNSIKI